MSWIRAFVAFVSTFSRGTSIPKDRPLRAREHLRLVLAAVLDALLDIVRHWGTLEGDALAAGLCRAMDHLRAPLHLDAPEQPETRISGRRHGGLQGSAPYLHALRTMTPYLEVLRSEGPFLQALRAARKEQDPAERTRLGAQAQKLFEQLEPASQISAARVLATEYVEAAAPRRADACASFEQARRALTLVGISPDVIACVALDVAPAFDPGLDYWLGRAAVACGVLGARVPDLPPRDRRHAPAFLIMPLDPFPSREALLQTAYRDGAPVEPLEALRAEDFPATSKGESVDPGAYFWAVRLAALLSAHAAGGAR